MPIIDIFVPTLVAALSWPF